MTVEQCSCVVKWLPVARTTGGYFESAAITGDGAVASQPKPAGPTRYGKSAVGAE